MAWTVCASATYLTVRGQQGSVPWYNKLCCAQSCTKPQQCHNPAWSPGQDLGPSACDPTVPQAPKLWLGCAWP